MIFEFTFAPAKFKNNRLQSCGYLIQTKVDYSEFFLLGTVLISSKKNGRKKKWIVIGKSLQ